MKRKVTPKTLPLVLIKFVAFAIDGEHKQQQAFCDSFNGYLDELVSEDAFGTEAQLDPRGDQRD